jgi:hypothetical protein
MVSLGNVAAGLSLASLKRDIGKGRRSGKFQGEVSSDFGAEQAAGSTQVSVH